MCSEIDMLPIYFVSSATKLYHWVSQKAKSTFAFSNFPSFEWDLFFLDIPRMDDTVLGHDFLVHWNLDVNWQEGVINLQTLQPQETNPAIKQELKNLPDTVIELDDTFLPVDLQYPDLHSQVPSSDLGVIAYFSN